MPIIHTSSYPGAPRWQFNGHLQTLVPNVVRRVGGVRYERERLELPDGDFVDLDWVEQKSKKLIILTHGLEGNSNRVYVRGMAKIFASQGWNVLAWHFRSCSGEMNRSMQLYHHGDLGDLEAVIAHALRTRDFRQVALVGFSTGGAMVLRLAGKQRGHLPEPVQVAVGISVPCDVGGCADRLDLAANLIYRTKFRRRLIRKYRAKAALFPGVLDLKKLPETKKWRDFDHHFFAPLHGFDEIKDFYEQASCTPFLSGIRVPALLLNAKNDPILTPACSPYHLAEKHPWLSLETPAQGGHCGFQSPGHSAWMWSEKRTLQFVTAHLKTGASSFGFSANHESRVL